MIRRHLGGGLSRAERMGALLELAKLRATDLVGIVGNTDETLALLDWLRNEAEEAAADDQSGPAGNDLEVDFRIDWGAGEAE